MRRAIDKWTTSASLVLVFGALLACKKKTDAPAPAASAAAPLSIVASALASATAAAQAASAPAPVDTTVPAPAVGDVKRFPGKEKVATGAVKVTLDESKVYDEPDNTKPSVASLSKDLFVVRQATLGTDWILVEFPSGVGKLSPGWIEAKSLGEQVHPAVTKAAVAAQTAGSAKPATAAASASAKPAASAALVPTATASVAVTAAPPTPTVAPVVKKKPSLLSPPHH